MNLARSSLFAPLSLLAVGLLAGCGGGAPPVNAAADSSAWRNAGQSMRPKAKSGALLYVSDEYAQTVSMYAFPSLRPMGTLSGFLNPAGLCVNNKTGDVWVTDTFRYSVYEFAHGGTTPIRTIVESPGYVEGCAVDPTTGDLAISNITLQGSDPGDVLIYKKGSRKPTTFSDKNAFEVRFLSYDDSGNLFVDIVRAGLRFALDELPKGGTRLIRIHWKGPRVKYPGGVQYDGTSLAVGDSARALVYQTAGGAIIGRTRLGEACYVEQFYISGSKLIAPSACDSTGTVFIYNYPHGGKAVGSITGFQFPYGVVVSR